MSSLETPVAARGRNAVANHARGRDSTDLEAHVNAKGRKELVKQVREKIKELGIQYIYYQFVSVTGRIVGKGVPADHWESVAERGFQLVYGSTANLFVDRHRNYIGYGPEASELVGIPDPETFVQLPWDKRVARVFCTCFRNREERHNPGGHLTSDCRGNLRIMHEEFKKAHQGLHMRHGCEPEMMWLKKGPDGLPDGGFSKPNCYHIDQFESLRPVFMRVIEYARAMGLDMIQGDHEDAPGQLELNFTFDDCLRTADRLTTYRQMAEDTVDAVVHRLGTGVPAGARRTRTRRLQLRGAAGTDELRRPGAGDAFGLDDATMAALVGRHGGETPAVLALADGRPELLEPLVPGLPQLLVEALWAVREELACTLDDVLARRSRAVLRRARETAEAAAAVGAVLADEWGREHGAVAEEAAAFAARARRDLERAGLDPDARPTSAPDGERTR